MTFDGDVHHQVPQLRGRKPWPSLHCVQRVFTCEYLRLSELQVYYLEIWLYMSAVACELGVGIHIDLLQEFKKCESEREQL